MAIRTAASVNSRVETRSIGPPAIKGADKKAADPYGRRLWYLVSNFAKYPRILGSVADSGKIISKIADGGC